MTIKKSVHENSPKKRKIHQKCPREFTHFVHENSLIMSTRSLPTKNPEKIEDLLFSVFHPSIDAFLLTHNIHTNMQATEMLMPSNTDRCIGGDPRSSLVKVIMCVHTFFWKYVFLRVIKNHIRNLPMLFFDKITQDLGNYLKSRTTK